MSEQSKPLQVVVLVSGSGSLLQALIDDDAHGTVYEIVAVGADLSAAREAAYEQIARVHLDGSHYRRDIALKAERGQITTP